MIDTHAHPIARCSVADLPARYRIVLITPAEAAARDACVPPGGDGTPSVARLEGTGELYPPYVTAAALAYMIAQGLAHDTEPPAGAGGEGG